MSTLTGMGRTVITSKETAKLKSIDLVSLNCIKREDTSDMCIWRFKTADDACRATIEFAEAGFEYVYRIV